MKSKIVMSVQEQDKLVCKTYGKFYNFQQQDGCKERGVHYLSVPEPAEDFEKDSIREVVNGDEMGVSFKAWLARDVKQTLAHQNNETVTWIFSILNFFGREAFIQIFK